MGQSESTAANLDRRSRRRWLQFSLRGFLVVLTIGCVWFGVIVNRARNQREAVNAIHGLGGVAIYDYLLQLNSQLPLNADGTYNLDEIKAGPAWLQRLVGDDYFQKVEQVNLCVSERKVLESIPYLKKLRHLETLHVAEGLSIETEHRLCSMLPHCEIIACKIGVGLHVIGERQIRQRATP